MPNLPDLNLGLKQVNIGNAADDGQGEDLRSAFAKFNLNMGVLATNVKASLSADTNYYVSPTGSDTNNGLSAVNAFATIQKALSFIYTGVNLNGHRALVNLAPSDYTESFCLTGLAEGDYTPGGSIVLQRDPAQSGLVSWSLNPLLQTYCLALMSGASLVVRDIKFKLTSTAVATNTSFLQLRDQATLSLGNVTFDRLGDSTTVGTAHINAKRSALLISEPYFLTGGAETHMLLADRCLVYSPTVSGDPKLCTATGNVAFLNFFELKQRSDVTLDDARVRYSGNITGAQFDCDYNSTITVGTNALPNTLTAGFYDPVQVNNAYSFIGTTTVSGALQSQGLAHFTQAATFDSTLSANGNSIFTGTTSFQGDTTALTPPITDNDQSVATTAFVQQVVQNKILSAVALATPSLYGLVKIDVTSSDPIVYTQQSSDLLLAAKAPLASPLFTGAPKAPTPASSDNSTNLATTAFVNGAISTAGIIPSGVVLPYAGALTSIPTGFLPCDGRSVSRTTYANLFAALQTTWGSIDAQSFNLPRSADLTLMGANTGAALGTYGGVTGGNVTLTSTTLPSHSHTVVDPGHAHAVSDPGHAHGLADPGHAHGVYDPGHAHNLTIPSFGSDSGGGRLVDGSGPAGSPDYYYTTDKQGTGVQVAVSATNASVQGHVTSVTLNNSGTGVTLQNTGGGQPFSVLNPHARVNFIIKI